MRYESNGGYIVRRAGLLCDLVNRGSKPCFRISRDYLRRACRSGAQK